MKKRIVATVVAAMVVTVRGLDNGVGRTPPLGYNTWSFIIYIYTGSIYLFSIG